MVSLVCWANLTKTSNGYVETNYEIVANEIINNKNVTVSGIYDNTNNNDINSCDLLNLNDDMLNELTNNADESDPMIYRFKQ